MIFEVCRSSPFFCIDWRFMDTILDMKDKITKEREELNEKRKKIIGFIHQDPRFKEIFYDHQILLRLQCGIMELYASVLFERIKLFERDIQQNTLLGRSGDEPVIA